MPTLRRTASNDEWATVYKLLRAYYSEFHSHRRVLGWMEQRAEIEYS